MLLLPNCENLALAPIDKLHSSNCYFRASITYNHADVCAFRMILQLLVLGGVFPGLACNNSNARDLASMASCSRGVVVEAESVTWSVRRFVVGVLVVSIATAAVVMVRWSSGNVHEKSLQEQVVPLHRMQLEGVEVLEAACRATLYREVCMQTLLPNYRAHVATPDGLAAILIGSAAQGVSQTLAAVLVNRGVDRSGFAGERVCHATLVSSVEQLNAAVTALKSQTYLSLNRALFEEIQTRLLAAAEFQKTCIDALVAARALEPHVEDAKEHAGKLLHNARAAFAALSRFGPNLLAWEPGIEPDDSLPSSWVTNVAQELLIIDDQIPIDVVVAKDGSGQFKSIQSAIDAAMETSNFTNRRYVIYVKAGLYNEQVIVPKTATGIVLLGDGPGVTIITGNRSVATTPGVTTFFSPTLIVEGAGFIGKGFTARNTAGAARDGGRHQQAVAMRVSADMATFYQCEFDGGQDALHTHTFRQLYRQCTITGPDVHRFVLGNTAIATFQSCSMVAKS